MLMYRIFSHFLYCTIKFRGSISNNLDATTLLKGHLSKFVI